MKLSKVIYVNIISKSKKNFLTAYPILGNPIQESQYLV